MESLNCCVSSCKTLPRSHMIYFGFPVDYLDMCKIWVQNLGDEALSQEFLYRGVDALLDKKICCDHLLDIDLNIVADCENVVLPLIKDVDVEPKIEDCLIEVKKDPVGLLKPKQHWLQTYLLANKDDDRLGRETQINGESTELMKPKQHWLQTYLLQNEDDDGLGRERETQIKRESTELKPEQHWLQNYSLKNQDYELTEYDNAEEKRQARLKRNREKAKLRRMRETPEERRIKRNLRVAAQTSEKKSARVIKKKEREKRKRMGETPEQREERLLKARQYYRMHHPLTKAAKVKVLMILQSIRKYLVNIDNLPIDSDDVCDFVKTGLPFLHLTFIKNVADTLFYVIQDPNESGEETHIYGNNYMSLENKEIYRNSCNDIYLYLHSLHVSI